MAVDCVGVQSVDQFNRMFQFKSHEFNVSTVKRTGHARFRRAPSPSSSDGPSTSSQSEYFSQARVHHATPSTPDISISSQSEDKLKLLQNLVHAPSETTTSSGSTNSSLSMLSGGLEGSVSSGKRFSSLGIVAPAPVFSSRKPPLPYSHRKRCSADRPVASVHRSRSECHCCKRRKTGSKREVKRVPIIGSKITSIPADNYSWKKYGERASGVYYKCSTGKSCPARKRVAISSDDSKMLIVTYAGEHCHHHAPTPVPMSLTGVLV
uniref:probable WRKY transcription factor 11 n=1 Tax=Erigeron canadensis TaxID=72917 RepID=UPI001CB9B91C|nr:probable WRKY transcription factor 11 [Erigeron canadensis]